MLYRPHGRFGQVPLLQQLSSNQRMSNTIGINYSLWIPCDEISWTNYKARASLLNFDDNTGSTLQRSSDDNKCDLGFAHFVCFSIISATLNIDGFSLKKKQKRVLKAYKQRQNYLQVYLKHKKVWKICKSFTVAQSKMLICECPTFLPI